MEFAGEVFLIILSSILVNNFVLSRFLGICPFLGISRKIETAVGMGLAVIFVMALASVITFGVEYLILRPLNIEYAQTIAFILVIATLVQFVEMAISKSSPTLYKALGVYLPLITTNCAVLGVAILNIREEYGLIETLFNGIGAAVGFALAIVLFAGIRERLELSFDLPRSLRGFPIALITAGFMSVAFLGFYGLIK